MHKIYANHTEEIYRQMDVWMAGRMDRPVDSQAVSQSGGQAH